MAPLPRSFYERDPSKVARELLGKILVHRSKEGLTSGRIVETEAYYGEGDPASRASKGKTKKNEVMWGPRGISFVYMVHGNWLFNVVAGRKGEAGAVLVRALEPLEGTELMKRRRGVEEERELTSGPGKLTKAMGITGLHHGKDLTDPEGDLLILPGRRVGKIASSHRIGVKEDLPQKLRFYLSGNPFVSKALLSKAPRTKEVDGKGLLQAGLEGGSGNPSRARHE
ncbi:MAG: DNA-3-methyladenine glycosylase [Candidatus Hadarchaeales archaeon]